MWQGSFVSYLLKKSSNMIAFYGIAFKQKNTQTVWFYSTHYLKKNTAWKI